MCPSACAYFSLLLLPRRLRGVGVFVCLSVCCVFVYLWAYNNYLVLGLVASSLSALIFVYPRRPPLPFCAPVCFVGVSASCCLYVLFCVSFLTFYSFCLHACVQSTRGSRLCPETSSTSRTSSTNAPSKGGSLDERSVCWNNGRSDERSVGLLEHPITVYQTHGRLDERSVCWNNSRSDDRSVCWNDGRSHCQFTRPVGRTVGLFEKQSVRQTVGQLYKRSVRRSVESPGRSDKRSVSFFTSCRSDERSVRRHMVSQTNGRSDERSV